MVVVDGVGTENVGGRNANSKCHSLSSLKVATVQGPYTNDVMFWGRRGV